MYNEYNPLKRELDEWKIALGLEPASDPEFDGLSSLPAIPKYYSHSFGLI
jgi:hypothetical protein